MWEERFFERMAAGQFEIDEDGRVWRLWRGRRMRAEREHRGYLNVRFYAPRVGNRKHRSGVAAHRVVYQHFKGKIPDGLEINHLNGDKRDNRPANLEAVTPRENQEHYRRELAPHRPRPKVLRGAALPYSKLCELKVAAAIALYSTHAFTLQQLGEVFGVTTSTMHAAISGKSWAHVPRELPSPAPEDDGLVA